MAKTFTASEHAPATTPKTAATGARRTAPQPKSSRQQFSACGACRLRRVKCDLKDRAATDTGAPTACSNCRERGTNCVDEFANVKAVKLLRRGRRLQRAEVVYGKIQSNGTQPAIPTVITPAVSPLHDTIPTLHPSFFKSDFFRRFHVQRPVLDPGEFTERYLKASAGQPEYLSPEGHLIARILVTWAASYGVDVSGVEEPHDGIQGVRRRRARTVSMVEEILRLIDLQGILRRASWDGVRALLLILPLTEEVQSATDRLCMYEAAVNQVYTLCNLANLAADGSGFRVDPLVRARIFWYAHVHEGVTTGLRGPGRLMLAEDDLSAFDRSMSDNRYSLTGSRLHSSSKTYKFATVPIRIAGACRKVHSALTGPTARGKDTVDEPRLKQAWEALEGSWLELGGLREMGPSGIIVSEDVERFVDGWKFFIFEAHNRIRETLKERVDTLYQSAYITEWDDVNAYNTKHVNLAHTQKLHNIACAKCSDVAPHIISLVRRHLGTSFFEYDASLVRDGCFYAGFLTASEPEGTAEDISDCLRALGEMRWAFSKVEDREATLRMTWQRRLARQTPAVYTPTSASDESTSPPLQLLSPASEPADWRVPSAALPPAGIPHPQQLSNYVVYPPQNVLLEQQYAQQAYVGPDLVPVPPVYQDLREPFVGPGPDAFVYATHPQPTPDPEVFPTYGQPQYTYYIPA